VIAPGPACPVSEILEQGDVFFFYRPARVGIEAVRSLDDLAQALCGICRQASYIVAVRNPDAPAPPAPG